MTLVEAIAEEGESSRRYRISVGRDELNLAEFPLTSLARHVPEGTTALVFEDTIRDQSDGSVITRRLTVTGDKIYGLPNAWDEDVIVALIQITKLRNNFTEPTVHFSRFDLVELLGWPDNGQSLRRLDESLNRWLGVTLRYEKAWWDKSAQSWVNEGFHMLDNLSLYDRETLRKLRRGGIQGMLPFSSFTWNKVVFRSFQAENLKSLDLDLYFKLEHPSSKRAYRFLDKRFYRTRILEFDLRDFACEHIGLSKDYDIGKLKEKLRPALEELERIGFIDPLPKAERYTKKGPGEWRIKLTRASGRKSHDPSPALDSLPLADSPQATPLFLPALVTELVRRGVTQKTAEDLVAQYPAAKIEIQIEVFDWLVERKDKKVSLSPAGYLVKSITFGKEGYAIPKYFKPKAVREQEAEAKRAKEREAAVAKRRELESEAAEQAHRGVVDAYLRSLTPEARADLETKVLELASPEERERHANPASARFRDISMLMMIREYLRPILQAQPAQ